MKDNMHTLEVNELGNICVNGDLSFATVPKLNQHGHILIKQNMQLVFDLTKVTFSDNAGIALLISWARYAKNINKKILFINLPKQLLDLVLASGLKDILPLK